MRVSYRRIILCSRLRDSYAVSPGLLFTHFVRSRRQKRTLSTRRSPTRQRRPTEKNLQRGACDDTG